MLLKGSFEDFLYILVGIVWVAFSIYKGTKSKRKAASPDQSKKRKPGFLEKLLEEVADQAKQEEVPYEPVAGQSIITPQPQTIDTESEVFSYDDMFEEENAVVEGTDTTIEPLQETMNEITHRTTDKKKKRSFDLKRAVIYSEILQPKYF